MAEPGTIVGEFERGWERFWRMSWWLKGPIIGFVALSVVAGIGSLFDGGEDDGSESAVQATVTATPGEDAQTQTPLVTETPDQTTPETATPTVEPTVEPAPAPPQFIRGLAAVDITGNLEDLGFECDGPHQLQTLQEWVCERGTFSPDNIFVSVLGASASQIRSVDASYLHVSGDLSAAADFLGFIATIPYEDASPADAQAWVEANISGSADTTFGSANYSLYGPDTGKTLEIVATGAQQ
jgi:hypothetical protein